MSKLVNIPKINQLELLDLYRFSNAEKENILVLGPSGAGKTDMCFQACDIQKKNMIYWNMSVMERPDIMGIPVTHTDRKTATFAPNEGMPFVGIESIKNKRELSYIIDHISSGNDEMGYFLKESKKQLASIDRELMLSAIKNCAEFFKENELVKLGINQAYDGNEQSNNVLVLDEIDKTPPENLQPLLELLLYRKINGMPLDIQSVIMTGNLPDEQAYSQPLSHAITNRAMIFELEPSPSIWIDWGRKNNLHMLVLGFLSRDEQAADYFNKRPSNNDMYSYAYSSPRSWHKISGILHKYEKYERMGDGTFKNIINDVFRKKLVASTIGDDAAKQLEVWLEFYRQYDSTIDDVANMNNPQGPDDVAAQIVVSIAVANKFLHFARNSDDTKMVQEKASHIFNWIGKNSPEDAKICAFRSCFDFDIFKKHSLETYEDTASIWMEMVETQEALTAIPSEKL